MGHDSDSPYNWIVHFKDHFSKFRVLFPMENKRGQTVATALRQHVFSYFGLPYILQADNEREFVNSILEDLVKLWPGETKIISGRARHPNHKVSSNQGNFTIERMVSATKETTQTNKWASWLPDFQCKYTSYTTAYSLHKLRTK